MKNDTILYKVINRLINSTVDIIPDAYFLKLKFWLRVGYNPNFKHPRSYNEKLQWLKLNDIHPEYTRMVDKITAKDYVASKIGKDFIIPTIKTWDSVEDIDWGILPDKFVIKVTSDSGGVVVCKDKSKLDVEEAKKKLLDGWGQNYYKFNKEYPYKDIKPRIIAETYMEDESGHELKDYKFFCSYGKPKFLFVATGRQDHDTRFDFYDTSFNHLPVLNGHPNAEVRPTKPQNFEEMLDIAAKLSESFPQIRVDLYNCNGRIYFGELTFFHWSGMTPFEPREWDYTFGEMIDLPNQQK